MTKSIFLIDQDLIALGRVLTLLYPDTVHVVGDPGAPDSGSGDERLYRWCQERGAVLVTADFNMLRDQAILRELLQHVGIRVIWVRQIRGQRIQRETERIVGRWSHIRERLSSEPDIAGYVLSANGRLKGYRTIGDAVVEVVRRRASEI